MEMQHTIIGVGILFILWLFGRKSSNQEYDNEEFKNGNNSSDDLPYHSNSSEPTKKSFFNFFTKNDEDYYQDINN